jgi:serine/threonine-protein kinase RsbW
MSQCFEKCYRVESRLSAVHELEREILRALEEMDYGEDDLFNVRLALDEACINAIKHGNREDPGKAISVSVKVDPRAVWMEVVDEGSGFDYNSILDPRNGERLHETGGRGLFLIQQFMEEVRFNEQGNLICMVYQKGGGSLELPGEIRKRTFNGIPILELARPVGPEVAEAWLEEVKRALSSGQTRIILDLRRATAPCHEFCDAMREAIEMVRGEDGRLVVICPFTQSHARIRTIMGDMAPEFEGSLPDAVRRLSRGEVNI